MYVDTQRLNIEPTEIIPRWALAFHGEVNKPINSVTLHECNKGKLSQGKYVDIGDVLEMLADTTRDYGEKASKSQLLPEHVLLESSKRIVWYRPRMIRPLHFRGSSSTRGWHKKVEWPPMLFIATHNGLKIFALPSNSRPTKDTQLYHLPAFNLNGLGDLCLGTASLPRTLSIDTLEECEEAFFGANSTHVNHRQLLRNQTVETTDLLKWWKAKEAKSERVKTSELQPYKTLGEVL